MTGVQTCALPICFPVTISSLSIEEWPEIPEITVLASTVRKAFHPAVLLKAPVPVINVLPARPRDETVNV